MTMRYLIVCVAFAAAGVSVLTAYEPRIGLSGRKDRVISAQERAVVLEVAAEHLEKSDGELAGDLDSLGNPFTFASAASEGQSEVDTDITVAVDPNVVYDDTALLELVAPRLASQVRGILARSGGYYIQLAGGRLLTVGDSLPFRLPKLKEEAFVVNIADITARGYTLKINEAERYIPLEDFGSSSGGVIRGMFE